MKTRTWSAGLLAVGGLLLGGAARADDTVKLTLSARDDAPAVVLGKVGTDAPTIDTGRGGHGGGGFHGGGFHGGGFHSGFHGGGFHSGFHNGFHNGHFHNGHFHNGFVGFRGFRGFGWWPGYWGGGYGYGGYGYGDYGYGYSPYYYTSSYYYPSYYSYPSPCYYYPISDQSVRVMPSADIMNTVPGPSDALPMPKAAPDGRTYPYDGGPRPEAQLNVPAPTRLPTPSVLPSPTVPLDGRPVSLPAAKTPSKFAYPAYGELPRTTDFAADRALQVKK